MQDKEGKYKTKLLAQINKLDFDIQLIELCVRRLRVMGHSDEILDTLRKHVMVTGEFNPEDKEGYTNSLQVVLNRLGGMRQQVAEKRAEYAIIEKRSGEPGEATEKHFDSLIAQVSLFSKFYIDKMSVTVAYFTELYKSMRETSQAYQTEINKAKR